MDQTAPSHFRWSRVGRSVRRALRPVTLAAGFCLGVQTEQSLAQMADANVPAPTSAAPDSATPTPIQIEEITVTAQKTAAPLNRVPVSVTAVTQATLDALGAKSLEDVARSIPGLSYLPSTNLGTPNVAIRGISSIVGDSTTGIYIDDTPIQLRNSVFAASANPQLFDLERIEVLRGPQGTLFGAGSEGGTIRYITPEPSLTSYSGYARAEVSGTQSGAPSGEVGVAAGGPIVVNELGFRASLWQRHDGGWIDQISHSTGETLSRDINSSNDTVARLAFAWAPTDRLLITPAVYYQRTAENAPSVFWQRLGGQDYPSYTAGWSLSQPQTDKYLLPSLSAEYGFDSFSIKSITSYFYRDYRRTDDYTAYIPDLFLGTPYLPGLNGYYEASNDVTRQRNFTEELRFASRWPESRLTWVGGLFFQRASHGFQQSVAGPLDLLTQAAAGASVQQLFGVALLPGQVAYFGNIGTVEKQYAGFGEAHYELIDSLKLTAGLRVARTELDYTQFADGPLNYPPTSAAGSQKETPVTPKFGISYQIDPATLVYANAAQGYRVGGVNNAVPNACAPELAAQGLQAAPASYKSDSLWSYELGSKLRLLQNRVRLNGSVYYTDWSNIQQIVSLAGCGFSYVQNLGSATSKGFELETEISVAESFTIGVNTSYTNAEYAEDVYGGVIAATNQKALIAHKGDSLGVPKWMVDTNARYELQLGRGYTGYVRGGYQWIGSYVRTPSAGTVTYDPLIHNGSSYDYLSLRSGVNWRQWDLSIFANNLLNSRPVIFASDLGTPTSHSLITETSLRPRTIGLTLTSHF